MNLLTLFMMGEALQASQAQTDPITAACAQACTEAYLPTGGEPVEARVFCKSVEQLQMAGAHVVGMLETVKQFDGDPIEYLQKALDAMGKLHDGFVLELKNGSAIRVCLEPGVQLP